MKLVISSVNTGKEIDNVLYVDFPSNNGRLHILKNHDNLITLLGKGKFEYSLENNDIHNFNVEEGLVTISNNTINVILTKYIGDIA